MFTNEILRYQELISFFSPKANETEITLEQMSKIFKDKFQIKLENFRGIKDYFFETSEITTMERVETFFKVFSVLVKEEKRSIERWENVEKTKHFLLISEV